MADKEFQDYYPDEFAHCYGCGPLNEVGMKIKSYWDGEEAVCHFTPKPCHSGGVPGFAYGGLIASLIDCHGAATASAAKLREEGYSLGEKPLPRFVAASLKVDYLKSTPLGTTLELRARVKEIKGRGIREQFFASAGCLPAPRSGTGGRSCESAAVRSGSLATACPIRQASPDRVR